MKCLLVADLHYSLKQFDWLLEAARDMDVVVIAGDHLDISAYVSRRMICVAVSVMRTPPTSSGSTAR